MIVNIPTHQEMYFMVYLLHHGWIASDDGERWYKPEFVIERYYDDGASYNATEFSLKEAFWAQKNKNEKIFL